MKHVSLFLLCAGLLGLAASLASGRPNLFSREPAPLSGRTFQSPLSSTHAPSSPFGAAVLHGGTRSPVALPALALPGDGAAPVPPTSELLDRIRRARSAVEASIVGVLDPEAILGLAEDMAALDVDPRAIPEPSPSGSMNFPFLGTPKGLEAELKVARSNNPRFGQVLGLTLRFAPPSEPTFLEGVYRAQPEARVQVWTDREGNLLDLTVRTAFTPDYGQTRVEGLSYTTGTMTEGVLYHLDLETPGNSGIHAFGLIDGEPHEWQIPLLLDGNPWPEASRLDAFTSRLLFLFQTLRNR